VVKDRPAVLYSADSDRQRVCLLVFKLKFNMILSMLFIFELWDLFSDVVDDVLIVPISISYDRLVDGNFTKEQMVSSSSVSLNARLQIVLIGDDSGLFQLECMHCL
jgi:hypothetical protein